MTMTVPDRLAVDVCVVGAGPAGSTFAARLAQLGHAVCLIERAAFPRHRLGESLTPGVLPLLELTGARSSVEAAGFRNVKSVRVDWDRGPEERPAEGLLVERGAFDQLLLDRAKSLGVEILQPATVEQRRSTDGGWQLRVRAGQGSVEIRARLIADACGRRPGLPARRLRPEYRTLALYSYWRGQRAEPQARIEAGADAWYWSVPLPDGSHNTMVFVDADTLHHVRRDQLEQRFLQLLGQSGLKPAPDAHRAAPVRVCDATPYLDEDCVAERSIKLGDAALALDPLSSSGVQQAIRSALAAAVVVNTVLRRPAAAEVARTYYRHSLRAASSRHRRWAGELYAAVAQSRNTTFWQTRAAGASPDAPHSTPATPHSAPATPHGPPAAPAGAPAADRREAPPAAAPRAAAPASPLALSPDLALADVPCIDGEFVTVTPALHHPALDEPLAFLDGVPLAPLIARVRSGLTLPELALRWSDRLSLRSSLAIAAWLVDRGILVPHRA